MDFFRKINSYKSELSTITFVAYIFNRKEAEVQSFMKIPLRSSILCG